MADPSAEATVASLPANMGLSSLTKPHHVGFRQGHLIGQFTSSLEHLFHAHGIHRKGTVIDETKVLARCPQSIVDRRQVIARTVEFPTQLSRIGHSERPHRFAGDFDLLRPQPRKAFIVESSARTGA